jgi:membrane protease YdiL (CAAX protease family)
LKPWLATAPFGILGIAIVLSTILIGTRATGMLGPASLRWMLPLGFTIMAILPWLLLSAEGRRQIGLKLPEKVSYFLVAGIAGVLAPMACFSLGLWLYGASTDNWFVSIANNYRQIMDTSGMGLLKLHLIFTIPACLFSPIGEEIFFRGFLQRVFETRFSTRQSTHLEAGIFGLVHLCHHGLFATATGLVLLPVSGALWVTLMFASAWMFAWLRKSSDSLFPAILAHSVFNGVMNILIFSFLWS